MTTTDEQQLVDGLVQMSFAVQGVLADVGVEHEMSVVQVRLLGVLRDRTLTMSEVAEALGLDRSSVSGLVARAEARGFVARSPSPIDGRGVVVGVTDEGRKLVRTAERVIRTRIVGLATVLSPAERRRLSALLEAMTGSG